MTSLYSHSDEAKNASKSPPSKKPCPRKNVASHVVIHMSDDYNAKTRLTITHGPHCEDTEKARESILISKALAAIQHL